MFFDSHDHRRSSRRRQQHQMMPDLSDMKDSGIIKALAVGALLYLGVKTIGHMTED